MSNHIHLIASMDEGFTISGFVRDCKKFTSNAITDRIVNSGIESRRQWVLHQFKYVASQHSRNETYQLWEHDNHFVACLPVAGVKFPGIYAAKDRLHTCLPAGRHQNPVRAGLV